MGVLEQLIRSWATKDNAMNTIDDILKWIDCRNGSVTVNIVKSSLEEDKFWFYDDARGEIRNKNGTFFRIRGLQKTKGETIIQEQPVIVQDEIGYLGILCKEFDGVIHFLMQAKIEPGNINKVQLSPTIQATKSNFTQKHGGNRPPYLDYFINAGRYEIIVDQIQSEQSSRFYKKRNRNIIIKVDEEIEVLSSHMWITLGQIKELLKLDNIVNMDARTVISCIPFYQAKGEEGMFHDKALYRSIFNQEPIIWSEIYNFINNYKMFNDEEIKIVPLSDLKSWEMTKEGYVCREKADFKMVFCNIEIDGREVKKWSQPLFEAEGKATFGLVTCVDNGIRKFLVKATPEVGCFDKIELGPTVMIEASDSVRIEDKVAGLFLSGMVEGCNVMCDVMLSEEGGRFYHEENRNVILEVCRSTMKNLPEGYFWLDYKTLNQMVQTNNCLNIQLRNLLSLLEV
jgi:oxidase EvaA